MGNSFFDWDNEDDEQDGGSQEPSAPAAPPPPAPAAPDESSGETGDSEPPESSGPAYEEPDDEQTNLENHGFEESRRVGREQDEKKRVGAVAARELAWGLAARTLDDIPFTSNTLDQIRVAARNRSVGELGLAQDLRLIAGDYPQFASDLHNAADKLIKAHQQVAEAGSVPQNVLPLTQDEAQQKLADKNREIAAKQQELKTSGLLRSSSLAGELNKLRQEQGQLSNTVIPAEQKAAQQPEQQNGRPTPQGDIAAHINATPGGYKNYLASVNDVVGQLNQAGIQVNPQNLLDHVPLSTALAMILKTSDPEDSSGWRKLLSQMQDPSGRGEPGVAWNAKAAQGDDPALLEIKQKQQRYAQVMNQLGNLHASQNWLSAIGMFLTAIVVGPKAAIMIWGRAAQEHSLRTQLQFMHEDIQQSIQIRQQQQNMDYKNRALAARTQNSQDMEGRRETASLTRIFVQHQLAMQRAKEAHGLKDPDAKELTDEFKRHMSMAGQALHEATDPTQFDQNVKAAALQKYHTHQKAAEAINKMLAMPEEKIRAFQDRKNGVPAGAGSTAGP